MVNGKRGETKTEARKNTVPVIQPVRAMLDLNRLRLGNPTTGVMFATSTATETEVGTPHDLKNIFTQRIAPILTACAECSKAEKEHATEDHEYRRRPDMVQWRGWHACRADSEATSTSSAFRT